MLARRSVRRVAAVRTDHLHLSRPLLYGLQTGQSLGFSERKSADSAYLLLRGLPKHVGSR